MTKRKRERDLKEMTSGKSNTNDGDDIHVPKYTIAAGQAGRFEKTTKGIGEQIGKKYGYEMKMLITNAEETTFTPPTLPDEPTKHQELAWGKEYDMYLRKKQKYEDDKARVFAIIFDHCDEPMKNRLEGQKECREAEKNRDVIELIKIIKNAAYGATDKKYPARQAVEALKQLTKMWQGHEEHLTSYYRRFVSLTERVEASFGDLVPDAAAQKSKDYKKDAEKAKKN